MDQVPSNPRQKVFYPQEDGWEMAVPFPESDENFLSVPTGGEGGAEHEVTGTIDEGRGTDDLLHLQN
jgi:hypothetical protein